MVVALTEVIVVVVVIGVSVLLSLFPHLNLDHRKRKLTGLSKTLRATRRALRPRAEHV